MSKSSLDFLSRELLLDYASSGVFERGERYFKSGCVFNLQQYQGQIVAKVSGTRDYKVKLWAEDEDELDYDCNCPYASEGSFCKHLVAVGLAWLAGKTGQGKQKNSTENHSPSLDDIKDYLLTRKNSELVEMLMPEVLNNEALHKQLILAVARHNPKGVDVETYRNELSRIFDTSSNEYDDYDYYSESFGDSEDVENVIESIQGLFDDGHFETVIDLCEYGIELASDTLNYGYESDGTIEGALEALQELHLAACKKAKPDVEALARRLFEYELNDDWGSFRNAASKYADVLGKKGLKIYRQLIEKDWEKLPTLKPGDKDSFNGDRYQIARMMESLALAEGDIEQLVKIKSRDLSSQFRYYEIAEIYNKNKQYDKVLEWAERGISDFPKTDRLDWRLGELLANEYHRRKRHDEAMQIIWNHFEEDANLFNYGVLKEHAAKIKDKGAWSRWREKALKVIRRNIAKSKVKPDSDWYHRPADNSLLVQIFLQENLPEDAWQEANKGGCSEDLWLKIAKIREKDHPEDSLQIYKDRIGPKIEETNNHAYERAVTWIKEVKRLMTQLGRESEFEEYLVALRVNYKIKRNFIKLLDSIKW